MGNVQSHAGTVLVWMWMQSNAKFANGDTLSEQAAVYPEIMQYIR